MKQTAQKRNWRLKLHYLFLILLLFISNYTFAQYGPNDDLDGDLILNINDLDDDNDGIPDSTEDAECIIFIESFGAGAYPGAPLSGTSSTDFIYNSDPAGSVWPDGLQDGEYTIAPSIFDANGDWPMLFDHTSEDGSGYAYIVNASFEPSEFYRNTVNVQANIDHDLSAWITNANTEANESGCNACCGSFVLPDVTIEVRDATTGVVLSSFDTGVIPIATPTNNWNNYSLSFNTGISTKIDVVFINNGEGGCGNDLAIDDIILREEPTISNCDFDGDGIPNSMDLDADNDGIYDIVEAGGTDADNDGLADDTNDADEDGLVDIYDPVCSETSTITTTVNAVSVTANNGYSNTANGVGPTGTGDTNFASAGNGESWVVYDLGQVVPVGSSFDFYVGSGSGSQYVQLHAVDATGSSELGYFGGENVSGGPVAITYTTVSNVQYIRARSWSNQIRFYGVEFLGTTTTTTDCSGTEIIPIETTTGTADYLNKVLPVELSLFKASAVNCNVQLDWTTESEVNFLHYELERSENGFDFELLDVVPGRQVESYSQDYQYIDKRALTKGYYRLRMVDLDGTFEYSKVEFIDTDCRESALNIYPNPISKSVGMLQVDFISEINEVQFEIIDMLGRRVKQLSLNVEPDIENSIRLDISDLPGSNYFLRDTGNKISKKFIILE